MTDLIQCPECDRIQCATIQKRQPLTYVHTCVKCGYVMAEGFNQWAIYVHTEAAKVEPIRADEITSLRLYRRHAERVIQVKNDLKETR